jgi:hypothetical protein
MMKPVPIEHQPRGGLRAHLARQGFLRRNEALIVGPATLGIRLDLSHAPAASRAAISAAIRAASAPTPPIDVEGGAAALIPAK